MSLMRQVGLLPAGCQPWNNGVVAASGQRFAYCATLAIYIYQYDTKYREYRLHSIMSEHKKTITCIVWHPSDPELLASCSTDLTVLVWHVSRQVPLAKLSGLKAMPVSLDWSSALPFTIVFVGQRGPVHVWDTKNAQPTPMKDTNSFSLDITQLRANQRRPGKLVLGHVNGSLSLFYPNRKCQKHVLRPEEEGDGSDVDDEVTDISWDPLSTDYLLVANAHSGVRMLDTEGLSTIMSFMLPSAAAEVHTLTWIHHVPGMFLTGDTHSGILRVWNVSKSTPIESIKLQLTGMHAILALATSPAVSPPADTQEEYMSSTSMAHAPTSMTNSRFALPPCHVVCTFLDGSVGLYDLGRRKWSFLKDQGHIETIFDCAFKPSDPNLLATASFDGSIKVWDINTLTPVCSSPGNEGVIYNISWAPGEVNCLAAATSRNGIFIWSLDKKRLIQRINSHGKGHVYAISWNKRDGKKIASCGADGFCYVHNIEGTVIRKYKHPAPAFGCDWNNFNQDMLATGCEDKNVRIFYVTSTSDNAIKVFSGHKAKVFHVRWSPLREGILCSGSDDCTIRIWDYTQEMCVHELTGHQGPVRGLLWSPEIPYLLVSGSWDYTIRVWDTRDGACLDTVLDHGADVYGLTCHPSRPFALASSSRDSTVRVWTMQPLAQPLEMRIIARRPWSEVIGTTEAAMAAGASPLLCGRASRDLKASLDIMTGDPYTNALLHFSQFFSPPGGAANLWSLVHVINGFDDGVLPESYAKGIVHMKDIARFKASEAQELELSKLNRSGAGAPRKEDLLRSAAHNHITLANTQRYCELMVELGEWEKALSVAPGVSMEYWRELTERYSRHLRAEDDPECVPHLVATGAVEDLVMFFTSRGQLQDAMVVAQAACDGGMPALKPRPRRSRGSSVKEEERNGDAGADAPDSRRLLKGAALQLADWHFRNGSPTLAACCHLAVDDCTGAMSKLLRGNELELAACVGHVLGKTPELTSQALKLLARRCERLHTWELGVDLLKMAEAGSPALVQLCARAAGNTAELDSVHDKAGLPSTEVCQKTAEQHVAAGNTREAVRYFLLTSHPEQALEPGLQCIREVLERPGWRLEEVLPLVSLLGSLQEERLVLPQCTKHRGELMTMSAYTGALLAIRRGYSNIVPALFSSCYSMSKEPLQLPLDMEVVSRQLQAWVKVQEASAGQSTRRGEGEGPEQDPDYRQLIERAGRNKSKLEAGHDCVTGSQLPCHSDTHNCCLSGNRIQGSAFFLEDTKSAISINDALMWAKVNPFSPLRSGRQINPF